METDKKIPAYNNVKIIDVYKRQAVETTKAAAIIIATIFFLIIITLLGFC